MTNSATEFDVVIVGGGLVGASTAIAMAPLGLSIAIVDPFAFDSSQQPSFDDRSVALSYGSALLLQQLGIWQSLQSQVAPILNIHVSDKGHFGICRMSAAEFNKPALGYVVENRAVGVVLEQCFQRFNNITSFTPNRVSAIESRENCCQLTLVSRSQQEQDTESPPNLITAKLVVAADGTQSSIAKLLQMEKQQYRYPNAAIICNLATDRKSDGWAFERFTESGPVAFLPLVRNRYSVVWSVKADQQPAIESMSDADFTTALQNYFGFRAGKITRVGRRSCYPLYLQRLNHAVANRVAFVGNALHTGHPVAGQGFNLGLRDIALLTELVASAVHYGVDCGAAELLELYQRNRAVDIDNTLATTDWLARGFAQPNKLVAFTRNLLLKGMDNFTLVKQLFANQAMGLRHDLPLLARGGSLQNCHRQPLAFELLDKVRATNVLQN